MTYIEFTYIYIYYIYQMANFRYLINKIENENVITFIKIVYLIIIIFILHYLFTSIDLNCNARLKC